MQESGLRRAEQDAGAEGSADDADNQQQREKTARVWGKGVAVGDGAGNCAGKERGGVGGIGRDRRHAGEKERGEGIKLPPPATALSSPATSAAKNRKTG